MLEVVYATKTGLGLTMITNLVYLLLQVGKMAVRRTANNCAERLSRAWYTHYSSTTVGNGEKDPAGGERLRVFCRECLGAVDGGGVWLDGITLSVAAWDSACLLAPATEDSRVPDRHRTAANVHPELSRSHAGRGLGWRLDYSVERRETAPIRYCADWLAG